MTYPTFDPTPYDELVKQAAAAFLVDTGYAIAIAKRAAPLAYRRKAKAGAEANN